MKDWEGCYLVMLLELTSDMVNFPRGRKLS